MRRLRHVVLTLLLVLLLILLGGWLLLNGSRPSLDGTLTQAGLAAPTEISRDHLGIAVIEAANRRDLAYATGFVHAQEVFFQMDIFRRMAAGELAELVGQPAVDTDLNHRRHRFRAREQAVVAALPADERRLLDAYRDGVNGGLAALKVRPWEYLLLRASPAPWRDEDSLLIEDAMFLNLTEDGTNERELRFAQMRAALPPAVADFLLARDGAWEAPLAGDVARAPSLPGPTVLDLRARRDAAPAVALHDDGRPGSNNFAVGGTLTGGGAIVADDMHLGLRVPNIWFRARLRYPDDRAPGGTIDLNGITLPGLPELIAGSNGHIAWGFTNSYGDWLDWVRVVRSPNDASQYRVAGGWRKIETDLETIRVKGGTARTVGVEETIWGPIMGKDVDGVPLALAWVAHLPRTHNFNMAALERVHNVREALELAPTIGMPPQNFVVGDAEGNIGWTLTGNALPLRAGFDPSLPADWSRPGTGWTGFAAPEQFPRIENPTSGRLWTANNRTTSDAWLALVGDGGYDNGARAKQIRDDLLARVHFAPADALAVQLDDRALFLARWQRLLQETLARANDPRLSELKRLTGTWIGRASTESVGYRLVRAFRLYVHEAVLAPFVALVKARCPDFSLPPLFDGEAPVWSLLEAHPVHLLDPRFPDWDALLLAAARRVVDTLGARPGGLAARTWGERNIAAIRHLLSPSLPGILRSALDMPAEQLPGDDHMPRVQGPTFGASERFEIVPGHEADSFLHMPGGQSDHPLSPYHGAGHDDWAQGRQTPLLPGPTEHRLRLIPPV
ncbi:MAG: penicillin acylase family protein [Acidobacteriia bacterium]|nr:penicillin acylase family protein [Terriglobia bacterium]